MKEMELNPGQRLAVETLDKDLSISAGAGSGKTRVLVARFCRIVQEDRADIDQVLTVTFTEKAAREMKERMVKRFGELFKATGEERFREAARRIESAYIGTIHSFAAKVLRENAFEAKVDPRFGVLTEVEADMVKDQVLDDLVAAKEVGEVRSYLDMARTFGRDRLTKTIKKFHGKMATLGRAASEIPIAPAHPGARQALETYIGLVDALLIEHKAGRLSGKVVDQLEAFAPDYPGLKAKMIAALERMEAAGSIAAADAFDWVDYEELAVAEKFVDNRVGANSVKDEYIKPAKAAAGLFLAALIDPISAYFVGCLKEILADYSVAYAQAKARRGLLDFDDLLLKTRELLLDADGLPARAAKDYRDQFKFVMVDEFQDTNELQLSLIKAVCPPDKFFTVGDAKQSIYSFMHSDIAVFRKHHSDVGRRGGSAVPLAQNYRSCPGAIDFINGFFDELWREDADFDFEPLEACGEFQPHSKPKTEILVVKPDGGAAAARKTEAGAIAGRIRALLGQDGQKPLQITDRQGPGGPLLTRALRPSDIVILFGATTSIKIYEQALNEAGIDFYVVSGRGFYSTPEVRDVVDLLKVVDNPLDDVAMAAVLRSPMVGLSDDALWWLTRDTSTGADDVSAALARRGSGKFYTGLRRLEKLERLSEHDRTRLVDWRGILERLHGIRSESRVVRLIDTAVRAVDYDLKLLASPNGRQKYANLRKSMVDAEALGARSLFALSDFIRHMETMETMAEREGEAPTEIETSPVVRLMTIHKAKGLEAPVVFVADCSRKLRSGDGDAFVMDKDLGAAAKVKNPLTEELLPSSAYEPVAAKLKQKDTEESKRLLYVAATRAKELLIFSGASKFDGKAANQGSYAEINSWMGWLEKALDLRADPDDEAPPSPEGSIVTIGNAEVIVRSAAAQGQWSGQGTTIPPYLEARIEALRTGSPLAPEPDVRPEGLSSSAAAMSASTAAERGTLSAINRAPVPASAGKTPVILGVTPAVDFLICPEKYRLKRVLGVEEPLKGPPTAAVDPRQAAALGSVVHDVLASVDFKGDVAAQVERSVGSCEAAVQDDVRRLCRALLDSPWPARLARSESTFQEAPFTLALPGCRLSGRIDLLFKESAGWVVVDYKTGSGADQSRYAAQVDIYALAVNKALDVLPDEAVIIGLGAKGDLSRPVDQKLLDRTEELLIEAARAIRAEDFSAGPRDACETCGYAAGFCRQIGRESTFDAQ